MKIGFNIGLLLKKKTISLGPTVKVSIKELVGPIYFFHLLTGLLVTQAVCRGIFT